MITNGITEEELLATEGVKDSFNMGKDKSIDYFMVPSTDTLQSNDFQEQEMEVEHKHPDDVRRAYIARGNNSDGYRVLPPADTVESKNITTMEAKTGYKKLNIIDLLKSKSTRKIVPLICFSW